MANMKLGYLRTKYGERVFGTEMDLRKMAPWNATISGLRECVLARHITAVDFASIFLLHPMSRAFMPRQNEVENVNVMAYDAVTYGRVIDFGNLPNDVIKQGGERGGPLWNRGWLGQPFRQPWLLCHTWEGGTGIYLINLLEPDSPVGGDVEVCELQPVVVEGHHILIISDRAIFDHVGVEQAPKKYHCTVAPSQMRFIANDQERNKLNNNSSPGSAAAGNVGDPLMCALLILNTRNIERETIRAPEKLQKARQKANKLPIPPYDRINAAPYVTAILMRRKVRQRGIDLGGHHASPAPHLRMGHPRTYASGVRTFIQDTLVNVSNETRAEFLRTRSHYAVGS